MLIAIVVPYGLTVAFRKYGVFNKLDPIDEKTGEIVA